MTTIRLLHISDLHVSNFLNIRQVSKWKLSALASTLPNFTFAPAYSQGKINRFLAFLRKQTTPLDRIVITGDVATTGRHFDLDKAFRVINGINSMGVDLCLLPGNHDRWVPHYKGHNSAIRSFGYDPGGTDFHSVFSSFWGPGDVSTTTIVKGNFRVAVVAADLSLRSAQDALVWKFVNKHGQGRVYDEDILVDLENATLGALNNDEQTIAVIWAIHFPPYCPDIGSDMSLIDEKLLLDKAEELGVQVIMAGHSHVANAYTALPYQIDVICAGTLTEIDPSKNQFFIIELEDLGGNFRLQLENYEYDRLQRKFLRK